MKSRIIVILSIMLGFVASICAQDQIYLIKGNKVVAKYASSDVDYVSFKLPEGVTEDPFELAIEETGKNYVKYSVKPTDSDRYYAHTMVQESLVDYILQEYFETTLAEADDATLASALNICLYSYGLIGKGEMVFNYKDGEMIDEDYSLSVIANQPYFVIACYLNDAMDDLEGTAMYLQTKTEPAGVSNETLTVTYTGLNEDGEATFKFDASEGIRTIFTMYGYKEVLDYFIAEFGYEYTIFLFGEQWTPEEINSNPYGWIVEDKAEYSMYALGIDANGDWVKAETHQLIEPLEETVEGPQINIFSKSKDNGAVSVNFEITPSNVSEAYVRLLEESVCDNKLNQGYNLAEVASMADAIDITSTINSAGEYTYKNSAVPTGWQTLLIMAKNADGTTVTRINFNAHLADSEWDLNENIPIKPASAPRLEIPAGKVPTVSAKSTKRAIAAPGAKPAFKRIAK